GGAFGGPIKKDKAFFYGVFEGIREVAGIGSPSTHVLAASCYGGPPGGLTQVHNLKGTPANPAPNGCLQGLNTDRGHNQVASAMVIPAELLPYPNVINTQSPGRSSSYNGNPVNRNGENYGQIRYDENLSPRDS